MQTPFSPCEHIVALPSFQPTPGGTVLPVYAWLVRGPAPLLIDAGLASERAAFLDALDTVIDPADLRFIAITHEDADHTGALEELLERAPAATVIASAVTIGKLSAAFDLPPARLRVVFPGDRLTIGQRTFEVSRPPVYDSPGTLAFHAPAPGWLFASDAFGAFVPTLTERAEDLHLGDALDGMSLFTRLNSPWLCDLPPALFAERVDAIARQAPRWLFASHLPPAGPEAIEPLLARLRGLPEEGAASLG